MNDLDRQVAEAQGWPIEEVEPNFSFGDGPYPKILHVRGTSDIFYIGCDINLSIIINPYVPKRDFNQAIGFVEWVVGKENLNIKLWAAKDGKCSCVLMAKYYGFDRETYAEALCVAGLEALKGGSS